MWTAGEKDRVSDFSGCNAESAGVEQSADKCDSINHGTTQQCMPFSINN